MMRFGGWAKTIVGAFVSILLLATSPVHAEGGLQAALTNASPTKPAITLTNASNTACQILDTAQGTTAITKVTQGGKEIPATAIDSAADEDIGYLLKNHFKTLKPGESATIPLQSNRIGDSQILRSTSWSADGGTYIAQYTVAPKGDVQLELTYAIPIAPASGAPACQTPAFASTTNGLPLLSIALYGIGGLAIVAILILAIVLWRRKKNKPAPPKNAAAKVAVFAILIGTGAWVLAPHQVHAEVTVSSELQSSYDSCMSTLQANRDITGPVLDALNAAGVHVTIVPTSGGSETTGYRAGSDENFTIYWNPNDTHAYAGTGGNADPCTSLYHEMYHVLDMHNGTFSRADCGGSGIETKEVMATRAQNVLRERLGMPARSHYGDRPLPSGDCSAPATAPQCTGDHCADTNGDPHLRTFDGLRYDFQAVGEFVAAKDKTGNFEVQMRQQAWGDSKTVSVNTAAAFKVGEDKVEIRSGSALSLLVNGKTASLQTSKLPGGGSLTLDQGVLVITWPDSSAAYVRSVGAYGVAVSLQPSDQIAGSLVGLLGNANGSSDDDLKQQNSNTSIKPEFDKLYPSFANSWRVTDSSSLFTYDNGKHTASYTNKSFPEKPTNPKTTPGYAAAERFCKSLGLTDPEIIANCALDLAITGQPVFAKAALYSQLFAAGGGAKGTTWQFQNIKNGEPISQTFDGKAGEKVFVSIPKADLPSQCGTIVLLGPDGKEVSNGCIINGKGYIDGTVLPTTGTYTIRLTPQGNGSAAIKLLRIADKTGTITVDGNSITARIDQPGVVARYTFNGTANQRIYTSIPSSTLGSQCGIVQLIGPDGKQVSNGCIINNVGNIDTAILPTTGQYTILLDPNDFTIGTATIRLTAATVERRAISINGPTVSVNLAKPGSIAEFTFTAAAGQKLFVDLPTSDLPSQCGLLTLKAPDGTNLGSGCVINHKGNLTDDATTLPTTGSYTITLNPNDDGTGTTTIRLRDK